MKKLSKNKIICKHDYKNAIKVGNVDYVCPLCKNLLDPFEWFLMNSFEFVDCDVIENSLKQKQVKKILKKNK